MFKVICVSGKIGVGKDYVSKNIIKPHFECEGYKILIVSLADHFKMDVINKDKVPYEDVYYKKTHSSRLLLQKRGTEEGRNVYGEDIWINTLYSWMRLNNERNDINLFIVVDCRFKNEISEFKTKLGENNINIRINAPKRNEKKLLEESNGNNELYTKIKNHISECDLDDYSSFDIIIDNDEEGDNLSKILYEKSIFE